MQSNTNLYQFKTVYKFAWVTGCLALVISGLNGNVLTSIKLAIGVFLQTFAKLDRQLKQNKINMNFDIWKSVLEWKLFKSIKW